MAKKKADELCDAIPCFLYIIELKRSGNWAATKITVTVRSMSGTRGNTSRDSGVCPEQITALDTVSGSFYNRRDSNWKQNNEEQTDQMKNKGENS